MRLQGHYPGARINPAARAKSRYAGGVAGSIRDVDPVLDLAGGEEREGSRSSRTRYSFDLVPMPERVPVNPLKIGTIVGHQGDLPAAA